MPRAPAKKAKTKAKTTRPATNYRYSRPYYTGRGSYKFISGSASGYGEAKIPGIGKVGGQLGLSAGYANRPYEVQGMGAYKISDIKRNVLIKPDPPAVRNSSDGHGVVIRHREFIKNITTSSVAGQFKIENFPLNPGLSDTFPWLSSIAGSFEEYSFEGLLFEFQSTCSSAIASSTDLSLGSVLLCTQYDPTNEPFDNSQSMLNYDWSENTKVSSSKIHFVECDPRQNILGKFYVRQDGEEVVDKRFNDLGFFSIATEGLQGTSVQIGRLWCSYQVRFSKPKLNIPATVSVENFFKYRQDGPNINGATPFGVISTGILSESNTLDITLLSVDNVGRILFPPEPNKVSYCVIYSCHSDHSSVVYSAPVFANPSGVISVSTFKSDGLTALSFPDNTNISLSPQTIIGYFSTTQSENCSIDVDFSALPTSPTNVKCDVHVIRVPFLE